MAQLIQLWVKRVVVLLVLLKLVLLSTFSWGTDVRDFFPGREAYLIPGPSGAQKPQLGDIGPKTQKMMKHNPAIFPRETEDHAVKLLKTRPSVGQQSGKPWPQLHAFTSWAVDPDLSAGSCEAFFGNGFTQTFILLDPGPQVGAGGSFMKEDTANRSTTMQRLGEGKDEVLSDEQEAQVPKLNGSMFQCLYSETLRTSICEGTNMIMYPKRIDMSKGGEALDSVMGRKEEAELPSFMSGAFEVMVSETEERRALFNKSMLEHLVPKGQVLLHTMHHLFEQIRTIPVDEVVCAQRISAPTVIVTRVEYANLFHTITDWYNAYIASRITNLKKRPRLVFVDGHCESPMDDAWKAMFTGVNFARRLTGPVCFDHLVFSPLGYNSPFFEGLDGDFFCSGCAPEDIPNNPIRRVTTARVREFGEFFTAAFNMTSESMPPKVDSNHKVLFVRREDYLAHPRHSEKPESRLSNEPQVLEALRSWASSRSNHENGNITVVEGLLAYMTLSEQLKVVRESSIIVGAHGAGLSHLLFSRPQKTAVLELISPNFDRPHFALLSQWIGIEYHVINTRSSEVDCSEVTRRIDEIFLGMLRKQGLRMDSETLQA